MYICTAIYFQLSNISIFRRYKEAKWYYHFPNRHENSWSQSAFTGKSLRTTSTATVRIWRYACTHKSHPSGLRDKVGEGGRGEKEKGRGQGERRRKEGKERKKRKERGGKERGRTYILTFLCILTL